MKGRGRLKVLVLFLCDAASLSFCDSVGYATCRRKRTLMVRGRGQTLMSAVGKLQRSCCKARSLSSRSSWRLPCNVQKQVKHRLSLGAPYKKTSIFAGVGMHDLKLRGRGLYRRTCMESVMLHNTGTGHAMSGVTRPMMKLVHAAERAAAEADKRDVA